eukprot:3762683-Rhodomonas_salina.1
MSLDTEGSEASILATFPYERFPVGLVALEANGDKETVQAAHETLLAQGFWLAKVNQHDRYYIHFQTRDALRDLASPDAGAEAEAGSEREGLRACRLRADTD